MKLKILKIIEFQNIMKKLIIYKIYAIKIRQKLIFENCNEILEIN